MRNSGFANCESASALDASAARRAPRTPEEADLRISTTFGLESGVLEAWEHAARMNHKGHVTRLIMRCLGLLAADVVAAVIGLWILRSLGRAGGVEAVHMVGAVLLGLLAAGGYRNGAAWAASNRVVPAAVIASLLLFYNALMSQPRFPIVADLVTSSLLIAAATGRVRAVLQMIVGRLPRSPLRHRALVIVPLPGTDIDHAIGVSVEVVDRVAVTELVEDPSRLSSLCRAEVDTIVVAAELPAGLFGRLVDTALLGGCRLLAVPRSKELVGIDPRRVWVDGRPFFELNAAGLRVYQMLVKRVLDVVASLVLLFVLSPLMLAVAIMIRVDSRGPVFFRQHRPGKGGRPFEMLKFRTMHPEAERMLREDANLYQAFLANGCKLPPDRDPRITPLGRWLRRTSLDELPQLLNVLRGDMSLVGPRPVVGPELEEYGGSAAVLLSVKPGITGLWQVSGRSDIGYPVRAQLDLDYVRNWSLGRDLWIMLATVPAVVVRRGAF